MKITFAPKGIVQIDDAKLIFRNFAGAPSKFNRDGDRNFAILIPNQEQADALMAEGWNVRIKPPREIGDEPFRYLPIKLAFNGRGPNIYLKSGRNVTKLDEETVSILDDIDIMSADLDIRPYHWEMGGNTGITAWLQGMDVTQNATRFDLRYAEEEFPQE